MTSLELKRKASGVEPEWLPVDRVRTAVDLEFDESRERVAAWKRTRYEDLIIAEAEVPPPDAAETARVLAEAATERLDRALAFDDPAVSAFLAATVYTLGGKVKGLFTNLSNSY